MGRWSDYIWWTEFMATLSGPLRVREREDPLQLALPNSHPGKWWKGHPEERQHRLPGAYQCKQTILADLRRAHFGS